MSDYPALYVGKVVELVDDYSETYNVRFKIPLIMDSPNSGMYGSTVSPSEDGSPREYTKEGTYPIACPIFPLLREVKPNDKILIIKVNEIQNDYFYYIPLIEDPKSLFSFRNNYINMTTPGKIIINAQPGHSLDEYTGSDITNTITLDSDGTITIDNGGVTSIVMKTDGIITITGNVEIDGYVSASGEVTAMDEVENINLSTHTHIGNLGIITSTPVIG